MKCKTFNDIYNLLINDIYLNYYHLKLIIISSLNLIYMMHPTLNLMGTIYPHISPMNIIYNAKYLCLFVMYLLLMGL